MCRVTWDKPGQAFSDFLISNWHSRLELPLGTCVSNLLSIAMSELSPWTGQTTNGLTDKMQRGAVFLEESRQSARLRLRPVSQVDIPQADVWQSYGYLPSHRALPVLLGRYSFPIPLREGS